jgi:HEAT repeat protein
VRKKSAPPSKRTGTTLFSIQERVPNSLKEYARQQTKFLAQRNVNSEHELKLACLNPKNTKKLRAVSCWALGQIATPKIAGVFLKLMKSKDNDLVWEAAKALSMQKGRRVVSQLIDLLVHRNHVTRAAACYALGWIGNGNAILHLISVLNDQSELDSIRGQAAESLGNLEAKIAVPHLLKALNNDSAEIRFWSAFSLGKIGDPRAIPILKQLAKRDRQKVPGWWSVGKEAAEAIKMIESR